MKFRLDTVGLGLMGEKCRFEEMESKGFSCKKDCHSRWTCRRRLYVTCIFYNLGISGSILVANAK